MNLNFIRLVLSKLISNVIQFLNIIQKKITKISKKIFGLALSQSPMWYPKYDWIEQPFESWELIF
jgi:hypothetical protein